MFANLSSKETYKTVSEELRAIIGAESLSTDTQDLIKHSQCIYGNTLHGGSRANIIAFPKSTDDVSKIVKVAAKHNVPIIPYSGGTGVERWAVPPPGIVRLADRFSEIPVHHTVVYAWTSSLCRTQLRYVVFLDAARGTM